MGWAPPTGVDSIPHRLRTIYNANMRSARSAGHWHTIEETKDSFPYLLYSLGPSKVHRDWHVRWAGTLLPVDDPWWDTHFPPNGWGCKCWVRQVSRRQHEKLKDAGAQTTAPPLEMETWVHPTTGRTARVPKGVNPGWEWNAGKHRELGVRTAFADHIEKLLQVNPAGRGEAITRARIAEDLGGAGFARLWNKTPALGTVAERKAYQHKPEGRLETAVAVFPKALQERGAPEWMRLSRDGIGHIKASGRGITPERLRLVQKAVDGEDTHHQRDNRWISFVQDKQDKWWAVAWKVSGDGSKAYLTTMTRTVQRKVDAAKKKYSQ